MQWDQLTRGGQWPLSCEKVFAAERGVHSRRVDVEKEVGEEEELDGWCFQASWAGPFPASLAGSLRGGAVDGGPVCEHQHGGASSKHAVTSRVGVGVLGRALSRCSSLLCR